MKDQRERFAEALGCSSAAITLTIIDLEHCNGDYLPVLKKLKEFKKEIAAYKAGEHDQYVELNNG